MNLSTVNQFLHQFNKSPDCQNMLKATPSLCENNIDINYRRMVLEKMAGNRQQMCVRDYFFGECVFRIKEKPDDSINKCKAWLVAKGFHQHLGFDFSKTFHRFLNLSHSC